MAYRLRNINTDAVIETWWGSPPAKVYVPGAGDIHCIAEGWTDGTHVFEAYDEPPPAPTPLTGDSVNAERDRRLRTFWFGGVEYDFGGTSSVDVAGAGTLALAAIMMGAGPGNLRWADPDVDFKWIAADNSQHTMDAPTTLAFAKAAASWRAGHIYAARALKDTDPIPANYTDDAYWPTA